MVVVAVGVDVTVGTAVFVGVTVAVPVTAVVVTAGVDVPGVAVPGVDVPGVGVVTGVCVMPGGVSVVAGVPVLATFVRVTAGVLVAAGVPVLVDTGLVGVAVGTAVFVTDAVTVVSGVRDADAVCVVAGVLVTTAVRVAAGVSVTTTVAVRAARVVTGVCVVAMAVCVTVRVTSDSGVYVRPTIDVTAGVRGAWCPDATGSVPPADARSGPNPVENAIEPTATSASSAMTAAIVRDRSMLAPPARAVSTRVRLKTRLDVVATELKLALHGDDTC